MLNVHNLVQLICFSAVCTRAEVAVCSLLLSLGTAFPLGPQFYFHQDHFDMHQILDLCMQITKSIERSYLVFPSLVKPQVRSHSTHSVELTQHLSSRSLALHTEWGSCELHTMAAGVSLWLETCSML